MHQYDVARTSQCGDCLAKLLDYEHTEVVCTCASHTTWHQKCLATLIAFVCRFAKAMQSRVLTVSPFASPRRASQDKRAYTQLVTASADRSPRGIWDSSSHETESDDREHSTTPDRPRVNRILTFQATGSGSGRDSVSGAATNAGKALQLPWGSYADE